MNDTITIEWKQNLASYASEGDQIGYVDGKEAFSIARYENDGISWRAYFRPAKWPNFGNSVKLNARGDVMRFASREDAQAACIEHLRTFGVNPDSNKRLKEVN
jgi:hypothetical protein